MALGSQKPVYQEPEEGADVDAKIQRIKDSDIRNGVQQAVRRNLLPAATQDFYPGFFYICADGMSYGGGATWPGLDSWQMAGAYLLLGKTRLVTDYFDYVRSSQRKDGNIPFAIFKGETDPGTTFLRGLRKPEDVFTYIPPKRPHLRPSSQETREWVGLFTHWETQSRPLNVLGPVCYVLTAAEIHDAVHNTPWLEERLPSLESAANFVASQIGPNGLVAGSGFYMELPPRNGFDGVTQCYAVHAFREMARLLIAVGKKKEAHDWSHRAELLTKSFVDAFWRRDHFGEYIHPERGLVDSHGMSDTNWAAVAFGLADQHHLHNLWPSMMPDDSFWWGEMPTQPVTKPFGYEAWEDEPVPFAIPSLHNDIAAMGRVWYLEALACKRMNAHDRIVEGAKKIALAAKDGYWRERYHPQVDGSVKPDGAQKYCEYPAVLTRIVLSNERIFLQ